MAMLISNQAYGISWGTNDQRELMALGFTSSHSLSKPVINPRNVPSLNHYSLIEMS